MSEKRETWEKALERGFRATEDMSDALMGRGQGDLDTIEDVLATLRATLEKLTAERDAARRLCEHWIAAQHFDPNGGPEADIDSCIVNAALVLAGSLPPDHEAVTASLAETPCKMCGGYGQCESNLIICGVPLCVPCPACTPEGHHE